MPALSHVIRTFLAKRGYLITRIYTAPPPTFEEFLQNLANRNLKPEAWFSFDNEAEIQAQILATFPSEMVAFETSFAARSFLISNQPAPSPDFLEKTFFVEIDAGTFDLPILLKHAPWIQKARVIVVRTTLGFFWSGRGDLCRMSIFFKNLGFHLQEVLDHARPDHLKAPSRRIIFVFEKGNAPLEPDLQAQSRLQRLGEALTYLSAPISQSSELTYLGGRGSFGFPGGLFNPGAVSSPEGIFLLARGESAPWVAQKKNEITFLSACRPVLVKLAKDNSIAEAITLWTGNNAQIKDSRSEDFRMFRFGGQLFTNHSLITISDRPPDRNRPLQMDSLHVRVGISQVDVEAKKLIFLGLPKIDQALSDVEKNWVIFSHDNELYLIYSFHPYHLLRATDWPEMTFKTVLKESLPLPFAPANRTIRNSVNPVDYDEGHFLHIVHQVYPDKQYVFWAILIDKKSLLPIMVSMRPLVRSSPGAPASIIYACSVVLHGSDILLFAGLDDSAMGFWKFTRTDLDREWMPLTG